MSQMRTMDRRNILILGFGALAVFLFLSFFLSYTFFTIESGDTNEKDIYVTGVGGEFFKQINVDGSSKTLFVKRGIYKVEAVSGDKQSIYERHLGLFSNNKLVVETKGQKESHYVGQSDLACSRSTEAFAPIFYSCNPSALGLISTQESPAEAAQVELPDDGFSQSLKPHGSGFLRATSQEGALQINRLDIAGGEIDKPALEVAGYKDSVSDSSFSVADNGQFAIYDGVKREVLVFRSFSDKNPPSVIKLPEGLDNANLRSKLVHSNRYTYLLYYGDELHDDEPRVQGAAEKQDKPQVLIYDQALSLVKQYNLPDDWFIRDIKASPEGRLLLLLSADKNRDAFMIDGPSKPVPVRLGVETPGQVCWEGSDSLYFLANSGGAIYQHSFSNSVSRLVYGGLNEGTIVSSLNCDQSALLFTIDSDRDGRVSSFLHYRLGGEVYSGIRPESILPLYFDVNKEVFKLTIDRSGIRVGLVDDGGNGVGAPRDQVKSLVLDKLKSRGVNVDKTSLIFGY